MNDKQRLEQEFLEWLVHTADYWASDLITADYSSARERLHGFAFSLCSMLDGCALGAYFTVNGILPNEEDEDAEGTRIELNDGGLHERYNEVRRVLMPVVR